MPLNIDVNTSGVVRAEKQVDKSFSAIQKQTIILNQSLGKVDSTISKLGNINTTGFTKIDKSLRNIEKSSDRFNLTVERNIQQLMKLTTQIDKLGKTSEKTSGKVNFLTIATGNLAAKGVAKLLSIIGESIPKIIEYSDSWLRASNSIKVFIDESQNVNAIRSDLVSLSLETRTDLESQVKLYNRLVLVQEELGASQTEILGVIKGVGQALAVTSTSAIEARGSLIQLAQAFGQGIVRAEEINSILEGTPRIAKAVADGLGVTRSELTRLVREGKITSEEFFIGLSSQTAKLEEEYANVQITFQQGFQNIKTGATALIGTLVEISGAGRLIPEVFSKAGKFLAGLAEDVVGIDNDLRRLINERFAELQKGTKEFKVVIKANPQDFTERIQKELDEVEVRLAQKRKVLESLFEAGSDTERTRAAVNELVIEQARLVQLLDKEKQVKKASKDLSTEIKKEDENRLKTARENVKKKQEALEQQKAELTLQKENAKIRRQNAAEIAKVKEQIEQTRKAQSLLDKLERQRLPLTEKQVELQTRLREIIAENQGAEQRYFQLVKTNARGVRGEVDEIGAALKLINAEMQNFGKAATFEEFIELYKEENKVLIASATAREKYKLELEAEKELKLKELNPTQRLIIDTYVEEQNLLKKQAELYDQIKSPIEDYETQLFALDRMLKKGIITQEAYNSALGDLPIRSDLQDVLKEISPLGQTGEEDFSLQLSELQDRQNERLFILQQAREVDLLNEQEYLAAKKQAIEVFNQEVIDSERARLSFQLQSGQSTFEALSNIVGEYAGESSEAYRALFATSKAFAITDATVQAAGAITKAWNSAPFPQNIPAVAATTAGTAAQIATIIGTQGNFQNGGNFKVGGIGGPDSQLVSFMASPSETVSIKTPAQQAREDRGSGEPVQNNVNVNPNIVNVLDPSLFQDYATSAEGERTIVNIIERNRRQLGI